MGAFSSQFGSRFRASTCAVLVIGVAVAAACEKPPEDSVPANTTLMTQALGPETLQIHHEWSRDFTGDVSAERLTLDGHGTRVDSALIVLMIRSPLDSVIYRDEWDASYYLHLDKAPVPDSLMERTVRNALWGALEDSMFAYTALRLSKAKTGAALSAAAAQDIANARWRRSHGIPLGGAIPASAADSIAAIQKSIPASEADALIAEIKEGISFTYAAGDRGRTTIAWSKKEGRFVRLAGCC